MSVTRAMAKRSSQQLSVDKSGERKRKEMNDNPWFERSDHPLTNDVVLKLLSQHIERKDLTECRMVCTKWNGFAIPFVRSNCLVSILETDDALNLPKKKGIENFVKLMSTNTLGLPFGRFHIGSLDTAKGAGQQFLQLCGITATEIILDDIDVHRIENISNLLRSTPNLRSFTIQSVMTSQDSKSKVVKLFPEETKPKLLFLKSVNSPASGSNSVRAEMLKSCPSFYEELFEAAENMSTLNLTAYSSELGLKILETIGKLGRESSIEHLLFNHTPDEPATREQFDLLHQMSTNGMKLQGLLLIFSSDQPEIADWFQLVTLFRNSLTTLDLEAVFTDPSTLINFPRMPKLKELEMYITNNLSQNCDDFNHIFPSLKKLILCVNRHDGIEFKFLTGSEGSPCPNMKSLILPENQIKMENLNGIIKTFPSLKVLECNIENEEGGDVMKGIWSHMTQLEDLKLGGTLQSSENVDSLVSGVPAKEIKSKAMHEFLGSLPQPTQGMEIRKEQILLKANKYSTHPSIRDLTNLTSLKLNIATKVARGRKANSLTDVAAYLGLYTLKNLLHLSVSNCEMSRDCADILVKDMGLCTWRFVSSYKIRGRNHSFKLESK